MMVEDRGKDEISAQNLMKKHEILEQAVDDYAQTIRQLGETVRQLTSEEHPLRYVDIFTVFITIFSLFFLRRLVLWRLTYIPSFSRHLFCNIFIEI